MKRDLVYKLPDSYAKPVRDREEATATNTWKFFELTENSQEQFSEEISELYAASDIYSCCGADLDAIGRMYGCTRKNGTEDSEYRMQLLGVIAGRFSGVSIDEVLEASAVMLGLEVGEIFFTDTKPASVKLSMRFPEAYENLPVTLPELKIFIKKLLPVGVSLEEYAEIHGKFMYCEAGQEKSSALTGTGFGEPGASLGMLQSMNKNE